MDLGITDLEDTISHAGNAWSVCDKDNRHTSFDGCQHFEEIAVPFHIHTCVGFIQDHDFRILKKGAQLQAR